MALTRRQEQVAGLVAQAMKDREIAQTLGLSVGTVKIYMKQIRNRTGCRNRVEIALMLARAGRNEGQNHNGYHHGLAVPPPEAP